MMRPAAPNINLKRAISASKTGCDNASRWTDRVSGAARARQPNRSAAVTVLDRSMAMVMGPTPPGTGVMAEQRSDTAS